MNKFLGYKKGINLGGWLSQCGKDNYNDSHYNSFITESDISRIASWGADHVRLPIDYNVLQQENGDFIESGFSYIDNCIAWCEKYALNLILDLHKTAGFSFDEDSQDLFESEELQKCFINLWKEISKRYGNLSDRITFELLNEITDPNTAEKWNLIADRTIKAIRGIAPDVKIIIGGIVNNSIAGLSLLNKPYDKNIVFTFHCYLPLIFTHQKAYWIKEMPVNYTISYPDSVSKYYKETLDMFSKEHDDDFEGYQSENMESGFFERLFYDAAEIGLKYDVPIYCGEYGVIDRADRDSALNWFRDINKAFKKFDIGHAIWTYKSKDFGITDINFDEFISELF